MYARLRPSVFPSGDRKMNAFFIVPAGCKGPLMNLFATHPPLEKRIAALSRLEAQLQAPR